MIKRDATWIGNWKDFQQLILLQPLGIVLIGNDVAKVVNPTLKLTLCTTV
jgi:hypothetical protein